ncbi:YHS domain-containing protein [Natronococcus wangiae]|nr:YHS domain-containing protein [Natronococcus sp. AD5]
MPIDPVCGMQVTRNSVVASIEYDGETYYFCSEECYQRFNEQPKIYIE